MPQRKRSTSRRRVALIVNRANAYGQNLLLGIRRFMHADTQWVLHFEPADKVNLPAIRAWQPHGMIIELNVATNGELPRLARAVVDVSLFSDRGIPAVGVDHAEVGRLAADHFLQQGHGRFAFAGRPEAPFARLRFEAFAEALRAVGRDCERYMGQPQFSGPGLTTSWAADDAFDQWLRQLPKPIAVLCANDSWGMRLIEVCRQCDVRVPEDVAVLGVGNDHVACELACPPLSSIDVPGEQAGFMAAEMVDRMLRGRRVDGAYVALPPVGVVARQSSDLIAVDDPLLAEAIRYIRRRGAEPMTIDQLLREVPINRRRLERRFVEVLGRTPYQEVLRVHVERAKALLSGTDLPMPEVAEQSGFTTPRMLAETFARFTDMTPSSYRGRYQLRHRGNSDTPQTSTKTET
jgi:LacI family transcriptional regulator